MPRRPALSTPVDNRSARCIDGTEPGVSLTGNWVVGLSDTMGAATERAQLLGNEQGLMTVTPGQEQSGIADLLHARELDGVRTHLSAGCYADLARTALAQMAVGQDAVVTVAPVDPDRIASNLTDLSYRRRRHGERTLLRWRDP